MGELTLEEIDKVERNIEHDAVAVRITPELLSSICAAARAHIEQRDCICENHAQPDCPIHHPTTESPESGKWNNDAPETETDGITINTASPEDEELVAKLEAPGGVFKDLAVQAATRLRSLADEKATLERQVTDWAARLTTEQNEHYEIKAAFNDYVADAGDTIASLRKRIAELEDKIKQDDWVKPKLIEYRQRIAELEEALTDIAVYGCGMLNQPSAMNSPDEEWLLKRIAEYERRARRALHPDTEGEERLTEQFKADHAEDKPWTYTEGDGK